MGTDRVKLKIIFNRTSPPYLTQRSASTFPEPVKLRNIMTHTAGFEDGGVGYLFASKAEDLLPLGKWLSTHQPARVRPHIVVLVLAVLVDVGCGGKKRRGAARRRPKKLFPLSLGDHRFGLFQDLLELGLLGGARRIKLLWTRAGDHADNVTALARALV